jgi:CRISP-associated protein Cas1
MTQWYSLKRLFGRNGSADVDAWHPPEIDEPEDDAEGKTLSPVASPIHVLSGTALVRIDNGVLVVERPDQPRFERPVELVSAVHIHGWATITSPCIGALLKQGTPVIWRGATGYPVAWAQPMHQAGLEARRAQYACAATPVGFAIAQAMVAAKIVNMRGIVRRRAALPGRACLESLQQLGRRARGAPTLETLLGIEGAATAQYFATWPEMISARAGDLTFDTRSRRPPQDEVNAVLSYAYAVLAGECVSAIAAAGLDLRQGFLHKPRAGRPALALDVMEPFRPLIADQAVLSGLNHGQLKPEHFATHGEGGAAVLLTEDGRKLALDLLEQRLTGSVTLAGRTEPVTWREAIGLSARSLADALRTGKAYAPVERP